MRLQNDIQVVLQYPPDLCRGFVGLPATQPVYYCVMPAHNALSDTAEALGLEMIDALIGSSPASKEVRTPCGGTHGLGGCHAHDVPECVKVLVVVLDSTPASRHFILPFPWRGSDRRYRVVPVVVNGVSLSTMPPRLQRLNVVRWAGGDRLAIWRILGVGGLGSSRPRLFISYVRRDSEGIAQQLFDHLHREGFEIFLDRFSIEPGVDFQVRLTEELSDMGTVLVIESRNIMGSKWVLHEVNFARSHRLGLLALKLPGGRSVPGIRRADRMVLPGSALTPKRRILRNVVLPEVLPWIRQFHVVAEFRRQTYLRDAMTDALLLNGIYRQRVVSDNILIAERDRGSRYAFRLSNLPPELQDFHSVSTYRSGCDETFVVAPAKYMDWRRRTRLDWLANECDISLEDEADIEALARRL